MAKSRGCETTTLCFRWSLGLNPEQQEAGFEHVDVAAHRVGLRTQLAGGAGNVEDLAAIGGKVAKGLQQAAKIGSASSGAKGKD